MKQYIVSVINPVTLDMSIDTPLPVRDAFDLIRQARRNGFEWMLERWVDDGFAVVQQSAAYDVTEQRAIDTLDTL